MAQVIAGARAAERIWASGKGDEWEQSCLPFLRHLLSPTSVCPKDAEATHRRMLHVTRLFLTTLDDGVASLPAPASFGDMPNLPFLPASYVTPTVPDDACWEMV